MAMGKYEVLASQATLHIKGLRDNECELLAKYGSRMFVTAAADGIDMLVIELDGIARRNSNSERRWCAVCVAAAEAEHEMFERERRTKRQARLDARLANLTEDDVKDLYTFDQDEIRGAAASSFKSMLAQWGREDDDYTTMSAAAQQDMQMRKVFLAHGDAMREICLQALRERDYII